MISPQQKLLRKGILDTLSERKKYYWITMSCGKPVGDYDAWSFRLMCDKSKERERGVWDSDDEWIDDYSENNIVGGLKVTWELMREHIKELNGVDITKEIDPSFLPDLKKGLAYHYRKNRVPKYMRRKYTIKKKKGGKK